MTLQRAGLALLAAAALSGCLSSGEIVQTRYYAVEPVVDVPEAAATERTLGVRPIAVARPYSVRMAYRDSSFELRYLPHEEWAENPGPVVTRALIDAIARTGRFADTGNAADMARPDLILTGELRRFYEDRTVSPSAAIIEIRLELREARGVAALWAETLTASAPLAGASALDYAAAMSEALSTVAHQVASAISRL